MDLQLGWGVDGADLVLARGDLAADQSLVPAVLVSLFSEALAPLDPEVAALIQDRRGYWAEDEVGAYGSLLWTLGRAKATRETSARARELALDSLAWMQSDGIVSSLAVDAAYAATGVLSLSISIARGTSPRWASLWDSTEDLSEEAGGMLLQLTVT